MTDSRSHRVSTPFNPKLLQEEDWVWYWSPVLICTLTSKTGG